MREPVIRAQSVTPTRVIAALPILCAVLLIGVAGCGGEAPEPAAAPAERVENPQVGVAIAGLTDEHFTVVANDGDRLELAPVGDAPGRVTIVAGPPESGGINLVAAVQAHKAEILERPDGDYSGSLEYASPLGTTFASRGRYTSGAGFTEEERVILMVHPWGDRVLKVYYHYPAGEDSQARLDALMEAVVGELEGLPAPGATGDTG